MTLHLGRYQDVPRMTWLRPSPRQKRTHDGRFVIQREGETGPYWAYGPKGSQDVSFIRPYAADTSGRAQIGPPHPTPEAAMAACEAFDAELPPHSRTTDPETSHEAGEALTRSGKRQAQLDEAEKAVREHPGRTSKRLAIMTGIDRHMLGRRMPDLEKLGRVRRGPTADDPAGRGVTWWPVYQEATN